MRTEQRSQPLEAALEVHRSADIDCVLLSALFF